LASVRALAWITFRSLLLNKLIILFFAVFLCIVLLMMSPLLTVKSMAADNASQSASMVLVLVSAIMSMVSGFGSLLAAWSAADAVASEMKTGTILAVMARPVRRWEFLLGKYLGVLILMAVYVIFMFVVSNILAWIGGQRLVTNPWVLLVYPMVRYSIYSALAMLLVTVMHPIFAFAIVLLSGVTADLVAPSSNGGFFLPEWLRHGLFLVLPSMNLLSESKFLAITSASLEKTPWTEHLTALAYGLDWALVCLLLAFWAFRRRGLARE
jgi:ABC-type transport system involved in multi-copper enzyme maturation permease subunit